MPASSPFRPPRDAIGASLAVARDEASLFGGEPQPVVIDRFELRERLAVGGLGVVYAARDVRLQRDVALKLVRPRGGDDPGAEARLLAEAQAMAKLADPNVVTVFDAGPYEGGVYLAMELVDGIRLSRWLADDGRPWGERLAILLQAGRGLAAAHAAGVVHRDFKPDNVLVRADGRVQVTDFGLAIESSDADEADTAGTPRYMAPEQHAGQPVDAAADQFAFCVTAYEGLYGRPPHAGDTVAALHAAKRDEAIATPGPASVVPTWIYRALARGLAATAAARWPDMPTLLEVLARDPAHRRRRVIAIALVTLFVGVVLTGAVFQMIVYFGYLRS